MVNISYVAFQLVFAFLNAFEPLHRGHTLYIRLCCQGIVKHFQIRTPILSREYICLAFHDCMFLSKKQFSCFKSSKSGLNPYNSIFFTINFSFNKPFSCYKASHIGLNMDESLSTPLISLPRFKSAP